MNTKLWAATLFLSSLIGCAGEEAPAPSPLPSTPVSEIKPSPKADTLPKPEPKADMPPKEEPKKDDAPKVEGPKAEVKPAKLTADEIAEVEKLPKDEQALALKQVVCPVSDEHLGEMGVPIKVTAEGKTFFLCCKSCQAEVKTNPKAVVAKLAK